MHSSVCDLEPAGSRPGGAEVLVAIAALVTEGRSAAPNHRPHCPLPPSKASQGHVCNLDNALCIKYGKIRSYVLSLWQKSLPLCIDVLLVPKCCCDNDLVCNPSTSLESIGAAVLLEQWHVNILQRRTHDFSTNMNINQLMNALRSQLYFSQISAWLATPDEKVRNDFQDKSVVYCLTVPGETYGCATFASSAQQHTFPSADLAGGVVLRASLSSLPRAAHIPPIKCSKCDPRISVLDDRMQTSCTLKGKHRCEDDFEMQTSCTLKGKHRCEDEFEMQTCTLKGKHRCEDEFEFENCSPIKSKHRCEDEFEFENCCPFKGKHRCNDDFEMQTPCNLKGKHRCEGEFEFENCFKRNSSNVASSLPSTSTTAARTLFTNLTNLPTAGLDQGTSKSKAESKCDMNKCIDKVDLELSRKEFVEVLSVLRQSGPMKQSQNTKKHDLAKQSKGDILLDAILRSSKVQGEGEGVRVGDNTCDKKNDSIISDNCRIGGNDNIYIDINCDNVKRKKTDYIKMCDISNVFSLEYLEKRQKVKVKQKITFDEENVCNNDDKCNKVNNRELEACVNKEFQPALNGIPSALEQAKFRKSLDSAASMVFHSRTGLPLTSSPAPVRRGKSCFDFDSSINSVSAIRSALFSLASCSTDEDSESDCSIVSPCSPDATNGLKQRESPPISYKHRGQSSGLLGSFVESALNGRLEPVSTVHGFSAELGASGSFCPRHVVLPVTVFFYTLGDNDKVSTPYLGHINLGKKGYNVPKSGTIQVTLFNPLGTVVKMFVIMYDLSDMPPNSQTFIRQRTLFMPANCEEKNLEWSQKWLRYLIHLRFMSSKSGRIYLHSDIRMIICRKSDLDTATAHGIDMSYELRSFINSPTNPRFSPRK